MVTQIQFDEEGEVIGCLIEAVLTQRSEPIAWPELTDSQRWIQGWK